ncbi:MAG: hypothetical protein ABI641_08745 [Caldimonas sp.]
MNGETTFDEFITAAWDDHADDSAGVARRLAGSRHLVDAPARIVPFARLVAHVFGEHLGQWSQGVALVESLRDVAAYVASDEVEGPLRRLVAGLRLAGGEAAALDGLGRDDRIAALAAAAAAWAGRADFAPAIAAYAEATALAGPGSGLGAAATRGLAVAGNNLAAALEDHAGRDGAETAAMIAAAEGGLRFWRLAGTWLEEERAELRLSSSLLAAGRSADARTHATRCLALCRTNAAPAIEHVLAHAALARAGRRGGDEPAFLASRAEARAAAIGATADEKPWCDAELKALDNDDRDDNDDNHTEPT